MGRMQNSMALAKASWQVLREDKKLTLLPLMSFLATLVVIASFALPAFVIGNNGVAAAGWVLAFVGYVVLAFVVVFFNAALVWAADRRLSGETVTIGQALHAASERTHVLLPWALVSATVSIVLRMIESRGVIGRIVGAIAGVAWSVVTFLVLPILVFEGIGPIAAVKRSGELFKRTWGENLIVNAGIGLVAMVAVLVGLVPVIALIALGGVFTVAGIVVGAVWFLGVSLVASTLTGILQIALYRFATGRDVPGFDRASLGAAFRARSRSYL